jgi:hypothetical protein
MSTFRSTDLSAVACRVDHANLTHRQVTPGRVGAVSDQPIQQALAQPVEAARVQ